MVFTTKDSESLSTADEVSSSGTYIQSPSQKNNVKSFTINDLERFSGIKAHTLRIWERRYSLIQPVRSSGNFRLYSLDELKKILNIVLLKNYGYRVSVLSKLSLKEIENKITLLSADYIKSQKAINDLIINMYHPEPETFENVLNELLLTRSIDTLIENIIFPFLNTTGLLWKGNKLSEEHLVVTAIRKKILYAIESIGSIDNNNKTVLLFLPDSKQLDLGLLYSNFYLKRRGIRVLYMGNDVTVQNLKNIFPAFSPTYLFTYLPHNHSFPTQQLLECMDMHVPGSKLIMGKYSHEPFDNIDHTSLVYMDFKNALDFLHTAR